MHKLRCSENIVGGVYLHLQYYRLRLISSTESRNPITHIVAHAANPFNRRDYSAKQALDSRIYKDVLGCRHHRWRLQTSWIIPHRLYFHAEGLISQ
jgi:hypothetical protein